ncbi:HRDC domain protein [Gleimia coleocanis DSM 15436]|uniref:DNA 3'-5' helicase n=1 Tax=Gleimia coleocanis DSM 15436 TaxID=525245 RepID=C0W0T5_9ACTO|nr:ATP-dependent DNA helicase UvrD2 [Gleimia coleocanis]EEH63659.1 HRDC domain protein [Gleimia coleocanis DSM 15436]
MTTVPHLLDALDPEQRTVATQVTGPLAVLAGAGTGKTRAITYRLAYGVQQGAYDQQSVLAVTFTARAAMEMRHRLSSLGVPGIQSRTFHAAALRQLSYFWPQAIGGDVPEIAKHKASLLSAACNRLGISIDKQLIRDFAAEVEWAKVSMIDPYDYPQVIAEQHRVVPGNLDATTMADLLKVYESVKTEAGRIDFEDVLLLMVGIMQENDLIARQIRHQYRHFVVDEFQDVSPLQYELLNQWLGGRHDICVVGDVAQTIYSFTGATPKYLVNFESDHPGARRVELNRNYRSTPQIVSLANQVLRVKNNGAVGTDLPVGSVKLVSQRDSGPAVNFRSFETDEAEATEVASYVKQLISEGTKPEDIAILFRTNAQSEAFENALSELGISYTVKGGERFFERPEIRQAVGTIRRLGELSRKVLEPGSQDLIQTIKDVVGPLGWAEEAPKAAGAVRERWESLDALVVLAYAKQHLTIAEFARELDERANAQLAPELASVTLSSLHAAKGLEWETVILAGISEGLVPISMAETPAEIEEEKRLLYVGVTRARTRLLITYARSRGAGRVQKRRVSRFLSQMWPELPGQQSGTAPGRRTNVAKSKKTAAAEELTELEKIIFEALREWRKDEAEERSVPAFVIFSDSTLIDIAKAQPRTLVQLRVIRGVGATKLEAFGTPVLRLVKKLRSEWEEK